MSIIPPSFRWLAAASLAFVALISAGCGSNAASLAGPSGAAHTATIVGRVNGASASAASVQTSSSKGGIRVTVVGTSITATTDASGHFTLSDVPTGTGSVALRFEGRGIDATLQISGLTPGQTVEISVQLSGNNATLDDDDDQDEDETQFTGTIESIGASSLIVSGRTVVVDSSTEIKDGGNTTTLAALVVGTTVEVEGVPQSDGSILARKIRVENNGGGGDDGEDEDDDGDGGGDDDEDAV
ncbi:MAG TPA: DUF5666 domain-containing protein [Vicinamibacteria bacterium]|nr:DUF5666 domain-containing protein [Vicinamibacteria bacterium]